MDPCRCTHPTPSIESGEQTQDLSTQFTFSTPTASAPDTVCGGGKKLAQKVTRPGAEIEMLSQHSTYTCSQTLDAGSVAASRS